MSRKESRRESREQAFLLLFEHSFSEDVSDDEIVQNAAEAREYHATEFALSLFYGAWEHREESDQKIEEHSHNWKVSRLSRATLAVLRLAIYELLHCEEIPVSVSINEAVELAKQYGGEDDPSFVNGVLGGIARREDPPKKAPSPTEAL